MPDVANLRIAAEMLDDQGFASEAMYLRARSFLHEDESEIAGDEGPIQTSAIVTGSRRYGTPRPDSDVDLVVLMEDSETLGLLAGGADEEPRDYDSRFGWPFRFGRLNLIVCTRIEQWEAWNEGTRSLVARSAKGETITRDMAVATFRGLAGLPITDESPTA